MSGLFPRHRTRPSMSTKADKHQSAGQNSSKDSNVLTAREEEVCKLLAYGYTNAEIAQKLVISERTVETHRANILTKLSLKKRSELVRFAIENRLLSRALD